jgi:hypothetical protein
VLTGTREVLPFGSGIVLSGEVTLRILQPLDTAHLALKDRGSLTEEVRRMILAQLPQPQPAAESAATRLG